jgi:Condensin complex subunit 2
MFNVNASKKFEATGGDNQEIGLNAFAIRKTVDVKRLKTQLWESVDKILEFKRSKQRPNDQIVLRQQSTSVTDPSGEVKMSSLMHRLYESKLLDKENVSIHSAFICMLHLANEKGLQFKSDH